VKAQGLQAALLQCLCCYHAVVGGCRLQRAHRGEVGRRSLEAENVNLNEVALRGRHRNHVRPKQHGNGGNGRDGAQVLSFLLVGECADAREFKPGGVCAK
jgi:hypothetical protein